MENNYECKVCNLVYKTRNGLYKHKIKYHQTEGNSTPKKYICGYCEKRYDSRQSKWMHEQKCKITNKKRRFKRTSH